MFGIPMVGPDTCGFFEATDKEEVDQQYEICGRWIQLATFHPFARHHRDQTTGYGRGGDRNEPWILPEPYQTMSRNAIYNRLQFVRQMYTCLYEASRDSQTCIDPLLFHYPEDDKTFENIEDTFIFANSLKVSPVMESNVTFISSYFPAG
jgi:alpha-glucosidase